MSADRGEVIVEVAGDDPVVGFVGVEGAGIAGSQLQRRGRLPVVCEAVEAFEVVDSAVGAQLGEQAATADGLQLAMVTDEHEAPPVRLGETHELMQAPGWRPSLPRRQPRSSRLPRRYSGSGGRSGRCHSWSSLATVSARIPVSRSSTRAAFAVGATPNTGTMVGVQVGDGGGEHPRLARTGRADHQHETVVAGHRGSGVGLQHIEAGPIDGA